MNRAPSRTWNSTRVVEALITAGAAAFGLGLGVFLVTGRTMALLEGGIATLVLLLNEAVSRPLLRGLARRGSAVLAVVLGLLSQLVAITLVVALGIRASAGLSFGVGLSLPQAATILAIDAVVISGAQWLVSSNDAEYVLGYVSRRRRRRTTGAGSGLVIVQLDGLGVQVFERALAAGQMPTVARWLHDGTHRLTPWWVPIPSTTPASQAAILFGDDTQIPSFRFWDRATGRLLVTNRPGDAEVIESGFDGRSGLLAGGGTAISTAFTGGADNSYLVFSRALKPGGLGSGDAFVPLFSSPFLLPRTVMLTVGEVIKELYQSRRQRIRQVQPRIARRFSFVVLRGLTNVFLRTMNLTIIADKIYDGAPVIFVDFVDYDEIAHHAGPERPEAMRSLEGLDGILAALERVIADTPTHYEIVIWSDHGQSLGSTFEQLNGFTLGQRVDQLMDDAAGGGTVVESSTGDEWGPINTLITATVNAMRRGPKSGSGSKELVLGPDRPARTAGRSSDATPDDGSVPAVIVVGGGNLGTIWFPRLSTRPTLAQIEQHWPALVTGLLATPGGGVVMASAGGDACVVLAADGVRWIGGDRDGQIEGLDPMRAYDSRGIADLHRLTRLPRCADLVLLSTVDEAGMIHAFEGQVGSHGGLGGPQNQALFISPTALPLDDDLLIAAGDAGERPSFYGAVPIHQQLQRWRTRLAEQQGAQQGDSDEQARVWPS